MKLLYIFTFLLVFSTNSISQIIEDLDEGLKFELIFYGADLNGDGEIQVSEAEELDSLNIGSYIFGRYPVTEENAYRLTNDEQLKYFPNIKYLNIATGNIDTLNASYFTKLEDLHTFQWAVNTLIADDLVRLKTLSTSWGIKTVSLSGTENIEWLASGDHFGLIPDYDFSKLTKLKFLWLQGTSPFEELNLDGLVDLEEFHLENYSGLLENITIKNGRHTNISTIRSIGTNLKYICTDEEEVDYVKEVLANHAVSNVEVNTYCTFENGGRLKKVSGASYIDLDGNGCDENDLLLPRLRYEIKDLVTGESEIRSNQDGSYSFRERPGSFSIKPILDNPDYFSISPEVQEITISENESDSHLDFCIEKIGEKNDVSIGLYPISRARPGFTSTYWLSYGNRGNTVLSGEFKLNFDNDHIAFISSSVQGESLDHGEIIWSFEDLLPGDFKSIKILFELNKPTDTEFPLVGGEELKFDASISSNTEDINEENNEFTLEHQVVNSFDPNDIICLEGDSISFHKTGEYVHYMVRFENTGSAEAVNIVVKDTIDTEKFDINSLISLEGSHSYETKLNDDGIVEFIFENINLPFTEEEKHGFVVFKIKTKKSLIEGDQFENSAAIYFDYNFPIFTNEFETQVVGIALPVTISKFDAHQDNENIEINWLVQSEKNLSHYLVERRHENEETFNSVGKVNATSKIEYATIDENLTSQGVYYYRLRMVDNDGISQLSDVITVEYKAKHTSILVYPNPATDYIIVENNQPENTMIKIHNTAGQEVGNFNVNQNSRKQIDISQFNKGLHFVTFYQDFNLEVKKIFIDK